MFMSTSPSIILSIQETKSNLLSHLSDLDSFAYLFVA